MKFFDYILNEFAWVNDKEKYLFIENWIEKFSLTQLKDYLKTHKVSLKTKNLIQSEINKRNQKSFKSKESIKSKETISNKDVDYKVAINYINDNYKDLKPALKKLNKYVDSASKVVEFTESEVKALTSIPGLPNRTGEIVYRGISFDKHELLPTYQKAYTEEKEFDYILPKRNFSSWSTSKNIAKGFMKDNRAKYEIMLKTEITPNSQYIDVINIQKAMSKLLNKSDETFAKFSDFIDFTHYKDEKEILYIGEKQRARVIYYQEWED